MGLAEVQGVWRGSRRPGSCGIGSSPIRPPSEPSWGSMPRRRWAWHGFPGGRSSSSPTRSAASGGTRCAGSSRSPRERWAERYAALFERYANESPPRGSKADLDDAAGFVAAICRWADRSNPPWAVDLARYELAWRQAARAGRVPIVRMFRFPVAQAGDRPGAGARRSAGDPRLLVETDPGGSRPAHRHRDAEAGFPSRVERRRVGRPVRAIDEPDLHSRSQ